MLLKNSKYSYLLQCLFTIFFVTLCYSNVFGNGLYFLQSSPRANKINKRPYPTVLYKLANNNLNKMWATENNVMIQDVRLYEKSRILLLTEGFNQIEKVELFPIDSIQKKESFDVPKGAYFKGYQIPIQGESLNSVRIKYGKYADTNKVYEKIFFENLNNKKTSGDNSSSVITTTDNLSIAGFKSPYITGNNERYSFWLNSDGEFIPLLHDLPFIGEPVPKNVLSLTDSDKRILFYNDNEFAFFLSVPANNETSQREVLIYNKISKHWTSELFDGAGTLPRVINSWIVSIDAPKHPKTDYNTNVVLHPIPSKESELFNFKTNEHLKVTLGKNNEVLWIDDNNDVYFRLDDSLYKARIENNDFVEKQLLITDPKVKHIHWAFRGSTGE